MVSFQSVVNFCRHPAGKRTMDSIKISKRTVIGILLRFVESLTCPEANYSVCVR